MAETLRCGMRHLFFIFFSVLAALTCAQAEQGDPTSLVKMLYARHIALVQAGQPGALADKTLRDMFFNADMAERIENAAEAPDFDPLFDAQDSDVRRVSVNPLSSGYETAEVEAEFKNFGERKRLIFSLMREFGAWRIRDISSPENGWHLQELYPGP